MSSEEIVSNNGQQAKVNFDISKIFIWKNRYSSANYTNSTYDAEQLVPGTVLGQIASTREVVKLDKNATDGSQLPCGILLSDIEIPEGDTELVAFCIAGDVAEEQLAFITGTTLNTVIEDRTVRGWLHLLGIKPVATSENTGYDN